MASVDALANVPRGIRTSLTQKLRAAREALASGRPARAGRMVDAFRYAVRAQAGKKIGGQAADQLIADANALQLAITCA